MLWSVWFCYVQVQVPILLVTSGYDKCSHESSSFRCGFCCFWRLAYSITCFCEQGRPQVLKSNLGVLHTEGNVLDARHLMHSSHSWQSHRKYRRSSTLLACRF